ncbi:MAG: branched-chain amino acid transport permease [Cenarchaeum symbiont of Oopsacas minuta]|nr:branched-chain amino acid transport permease [Cenarchaeum symbiont of Oopsacas minuta]
MVDPIYTDALIYASLLATLAIGLTLTYITTRVPNFAHASIAMIGAYITLIITRIVDMNPYISIPISFIIAGTVSLGLYTFILKPLIRRNASKAIQMISTIAFDLVLIGVLNIVADYIVMTYKIPSREFTLRGYDLAVGDAPMILIIAPILITSLAFTLHIMLRKTKFGVSMRAAIENPDLAQVVGINIKIIYAVAWFLGGAMAGVAGALISLWFQGDPSLGITMMPSIFAASIVGGFFSIYGAIAGGMLIGMTEILGTRFLAGELGTWIISYRPLIPLLFIVITIMIAPNGLAGIKWKEVAKRIGIRK